MPDAVVGRQTWVHLAWQIPCSDPSQEHLLALFLEGFREADPAPALLIPIHRGFLPSLTALLFAVGGKHPLDEILQQVSVDFEKIGGYGVKSLTTFDVVSE